MRSLLISDLHSNGEALGAILRHVRRKRVGRLLCLGDLVGYGASPNRVVEMLDRTRRTKVIIRGNHDRVAIGLSEPDDFNEVARDAVLWTREHLSAASRGFLRNLPTGPVISGEGEGFLICHGSPDNEDEYVLNDVQAARIFSDWPQRLIFFGHTHLPCIFRLGEGSLESRLIEGNETVRLERGFRYLINPGSVGQPRDRDWRTSCAIWDDQRDSVQFFRLEYDVEETRRSIESAGLPQILSDRLAAGF